MIKRKIINLEKALEKVI